MLTLLFSNQPILLGVPEIEILSRLSELFEKHFPHSHQWTIIVSFVSSQKIRAINRRFRHIDWATDILSFRYNETKQTENMTPIGELLLSEKKIIAQAIEHGTSEKEELAHLIIHGILHIIGFDHENDHDALAMETYESRLLTAMKKHS